MFRYFYPAFMTNTNNWNYFLDGVEELITDYQQKWVERSSQNIITHFQHVKISKFIRLICIYIFVLNTSYLLTNHIVFAMKFVTNQWWGVIKCRYCSCRGRSLIVVYQCLINLKNIPLQLLYWNYWEMMTKPVFFFNTVDSSTTVFDNLFVWSTTDIIHIKLAYHVTKYIL